MANRSSEAKRARLIERRLSKDKRPEISALTAAQVRHHYQAHDYPQPVPGMPRIKKQLEETMANLTERDLEVIRFIGQIRLVTAPQIAAAFWGLRKSSELMARKQLTKLAYRHLVYRVPRPRSRKGDQRFGPRHAYFLGKAGAVLLGDGARWPWIDHPDRVDHRFRHDLDVTEIFLDAARSNHEAHLGGTEVRLQLQLLNCWAAPHLDVGARFASFVTDGDQLQVGGERLIKPDGLLAFGVELGDHSFLAPALIENDTGTQKQYAVANQLANYDFLNRSSAIKRRFPDLDIDGYRVPVLVIAELSPTPFDKSATVEKRIAGLRRALAKELRQRGYKTFAALPPILITSRQEWREQGIHAPVFDMRLPEQEPDQRRSALAELVLASRPVAEAGQLDATSRLRIDSEAAVWRGPMLEARAQRDRNQSAKARQKARRNQIEQLEAKIEQLQGGRSA